MEEPPSQHINKAVKNTYTKSVEVHKNDKFQRSCFDSPQSKGS